MSVIVNTSLPADIPRYITYTRRLRNCRSNGIQGSNADFLICAVAHRRNYSILTIDKDFQIFQAYIPVLLLTVDG